MSNSYPKMDGKANIYNGHTDDTYVTNLLFNQNNEIKVLNAREELRKNSVVLKKAKDIEEFGFTNLENLNQTTLKDKPN